MRIGIVGPDRLIIAVAIAEVGLPNVNGDDRLVAVVVHVHRIDVVRLTISTVMNGTGTAIESETAIVIAMEGEGTAPVRIVPADRDLIQGK